MAVGGGAEEGLLAGVEPVEGLGIGVEGEVLDGVGGRVNCHQPIPIQIRALNRRAFCPVEIALNRVYQQGATVGVAHYLHCACAIAVAPHDEGGGTTRCARRLEPVDTAAGLIHGQGDVGHVDHTAGVGIVDDDLRGDAKRVGADDGVGDEVVEVEPAAYGVRGEGVPCDTAVVEEDGFDGVVIALGDAH